MKKMRPRTIFAFSTEHLLKKDKIRYYYALKGRDGKSGIAKKYAIEHLGRAVLMVPDEHSQELEQFFKYWKCNYRTKKVLIEREK